jgi:hypothetical protein
MTDNQRDKEELKERVSIWMHKMFEYGLTEKTLETKYKVSRQYINNIKNKTGSVGLEVIKKVISIDNKINVRWLLMGEGEMYSENNYSPADDTFKANILENKYDTIDKTAYTTVVRAWEQDRVLWTNQISLLNEIIEKKL